VLGLMVGAYAIGYHRGKSHRAAARATTTTPTTTAATTSASPGGDAAAAGKKLFTDDACAGCHSLNGSPGAGPTVSGLAGSTVTLADGTTATADEAYLARAITDPDAEIVKGYRAGVMSGAIAGFGLDGKPDDVAALVAFIKAQR
jgi:cytochrome c oxidase subunit 2